MMGEFLLAGVIADGRQRGNAGCAGSQGVFAHMHRSCTARRTLDCIRPDECTGNGVAA